MLLSSREIKAKLLHKYSIIVSDILLYSGLSPYDLEYTFCGQTKSDKLCKDRPVTAI